MIRIVLVLALVLLTVGLGLYSIYEEHKRDSEARAIFERIDRLVALINATAKKRHAAGSCTTVGMDGNADWQLVMNSELETSLLYETLMDGGHTIADVVESHRPAFCHCDTSRADCSFNCRNGPRIMVCWVWVTRFRDLH